jgi:ATP-dependent RNA helicase RhlE
MNHFSELSLSPVLKGNLARHNFTTPTPVQAQAIPAALLGRDVLATAQTGTGKTLAFVLPLLATLSKDRKDGVRAVILVPTRELAMQVLDTFSKLNPGTGVTGALIVGGVSEHGQIMAIRKGAQVLVATPGRLIDFLRRRLVRLDAVEISVLDEADRMLDMGFLPAIQLILAAMPAKRQTLFFSATIESSVTHLVQSHLNNPVRVEIGSTTRPAENVQLHVYEVDHDQKLTLLQRLLAEQSGSFLVFSRTKHGADRLSKRLKGAGVNSTRLHGDRTQSQRNEALRGFQEGRYRVLVATDVAARGIHVDNIAHVVNYDLPQAPEDFIHRVGRTGRANARGVASTFATRSERAEIRRIERTLKVTLRRVAEREPAARAIA